MSVLPPAGNTAQTRPENRAFYPALDGLRAVAFLMVFGQHYLALAWGWTGVNVFFVLSGFLITGILFDTRDDSHRARNFYLRRSLRIFPLYYGLFAILLLLWPAMHWRWDRLWLAWPLYLGNFLSFLSPSVLVPRSPLELAADAHLTSALLPRSEIYLGHLWSLCVEEQFYLLWPWVVFLVRDSRKLLWTCAIGVAAGPLLRLALQHSAPAWMLQAALLDHFTPAQMDALLLGGGVALLWRGAARARLLVPCRVVALLCTGVLIAYLVLVVHGIRMAPGQYPPWMYTGGLLFANVYAASIMVCALQPGTWTYIVLSREPLRWIGRLSYGAYIFHDLLHGLFVHVVVHSAARLGKGSIRPDLAAAVLALPATLLLAWLSFRFYERPFLNLKEHWTRVGSRQLEPAT